MLLLFIRSFGFEETVGMIMVTSINYFFLIMMNAVHSIDYADIIKLMQRAIRQSKIKLNFLTPVTRYRDTRYGQ
jgi:hypothetical protein